MNLAAEGAAAKSYDFAFEKNYEPRAPNGARGVFY